MQPPEKVVPIEIPEVPTFVPTKPKGLLDDPYKINPRRTAALWRAMGGAKAKAIKQVEELASVKAELDKSKAVWEREMDATRAMSKQDAVQAQALATAKLERALADQRAKFEPQIATLQERLVGLHDRVNLAREKVKAAHEQELATLRHKATEREAVTIKSGQAEVDKIRAQLEAERVKVATGVAETKGNLALLQSKLDDANNRLRDERERATAKLHASERSASEAAIRATEQANANLNAVIAEREKDRQAAKDQIRANRQLVETARAQPGTEAPDREKRIREAMAKIATLQRALGTAEGTAKGLAQQLASEKNVSLGQVTRLAQLAGDLDKARQQAALARSQGQTGQSAAVANERRLQADLTRAQAELGMTQQETQRLKVEVASAPFKSAAQISALKAQVAGLQSRVEDFRVRALSGDTQHRMDLVDAERELADKSAELQRQYEKGRQAGIAEGAQQETLKSQGALAAARREAKQAMDAVRSEVTSLQSKLQAGERQNKQELTARMAEASRQLEAERGKLNADLAGLRTELTTARQEGATRLEALRAKSASELAAAEQRREADVSAAQSGREAELTVESQQHQRDLELAQLGTREAERRLQQAQLSAKDQISALTRDKDQIIQGLRDRLSGFEARAARHAGEISQARELQDVAERERTTTATLQEQTQAKVHQEQAEVKRVLELLKTDTARINSTHATQLDQMRTGHAAAQANAVKQVVAREQALLQSTQDDHNKQITAKDAEIQRHMKANAQANQDLKNAQTMHDNQLAGMRKNLQLSVDKNSAHLVEIERLRSLSAQRATDIKRMFAQGEVQEETARLALVQATAETQRMEQVAAQLYANGENLKAVHQQQAHQFAGQAAARHDQLMRQSAESTAAAHRLGEERAALIASKHEQQKAIYEQMRKVERDFEQARTSMITNPQQQTVEHYRSLAGQHTGNSHIQGMQAEIEGLWKSHQAQPPPAVQQLAQQIVRKPLPSPMEPDPMGKPEAPAPPPAPGREGIELPPAIQEDRPTPTPAPQIKFPPVLQAKAIEGEEIPYGFEDMPDAPPTIPRAPIRSLQEVVGVEVYAKYQDRVQAAMKEVQTGMYRGRKEEQAAFAQFNQNPDVNTQDINARPETRYKIERMQDGLQQAHAQIQTREAELAKMAPQDKQNQLEEDRLEAMYQLYQAKQRRELMEEYRNQGRSQTSAEVDAEIAKDEVRFSEMLRSTNEQIAKNTVGAPPDALWGDNPADIARARERNTEYLKMEIKETRAELAQTPVAAPVREQMIAEREQIIRNAARMDRLARTKPKRKRSRPVAPEMLQKKRKTGAATAITEEIQEAAPMEPAAVPDAPGKHVTAVLKQRKQFVEAVKYVATPWWDAKKNKTFGTKGKNTKAANQLAKTSGATVAKQVREHQQRAQQRRGQVPKVTRQAAKFSPIKNPPDKVKKIANKESFRGLAEKDARSIRLEYQLITKDATLAEQRTPRFKAARDLESILDEVISDIAGHTSTFSRVGPQIRGAPGFDEPVQFIRPPSARALERLPATQRRAMPRPTAPKRTAAAATAPRVPRTRGKRQGVPDTPPDLEALAESEVQDMTPEQILQSLEGSGLGKKPRKRVKRRKSKQKTPKKAAKSPKKQVKRPKTGLQKWNSQRKTTRRMRL